MTPSTIYANMAHCRGFGAMYLALGEQARVFAVVGSQD